MRMPLSSEERTIRENSIVENFWESSWLKLSLIYFHREL